MHELTDPPDEDDSIWDDDLFSGDGDTAAFDEHDYDFETDPIDTDLGEDWSPDESKLPRRRRKKSKKRKKKKTEVDPIVQDVTTSSQRSLDDLTEGTYNKKHYFSDGTGKFVGMLLINLSIAVVVIFALGYVKYSLRETGGMEQADNNSPRSKIGLATDLAADAIENFSEEEPNHKQPTVIPERTRTQEEILEATLEMARTYDIDLRPITSHKWTVGDAKKQWKLDADAGPTLNGVVQLSKSLPLAQLGYSGRFVSVRERYASRKQSPVIVEPSTMQGWTFSGEMEPVSTARLDGFNIHPQVTDYSNDLKYFAKHIKITSPKEVTLVKGKFITKQADWNGITIHKLNNALISVIPSAHEAKFVSDQRVLIAAKKAIIDPQGEKPVPRRRDGMKAQALFFRDVVTGEDSDSIDVPLGGRWVLSPGRKFLVVVAPDEKTVRNLHEHPDVTFDYRPQSVEIQIYETATANKVAEGHFPGQTIGMFPVFSHDGTRLAMSANEHITVVDMTNGSVVASGTLPLKDTNTVGRVDWIGGSNFLRYARSQIIAIPEGTELTGVFGTHQTVNPEHKSKPPFNLPNFLFASHFGRDDPYASYAEVSGDELKLLQDQLDDPNSNLMVERKVNFEIYGSDSPVVRECLKRIFTSRYKLNIDAEPSLDLVSIKVVYSESRARHDPRTARSPDDKLAIRLNVNCVTPTHESLASAAVEATVVPPVFAPGIPKKDQLRIASCLQAGHDLEFDLPDYVPVSGTPISHDLLWTTTAIQDLSALSDIQIKTVEVDNSWINDDHGIPLNLTAP